MNRCGSYWLKFVSMKAKTTGLRHPWGLVQRTFSEDSSEEPEREVCPYNSWLWLRLESPSDPDLRLNLGILLLIAEIA